MAWKGLTGLWWWIDRWRKSSAYMDMTLEQQGAYRNLLDEATLRGGALPTDERILAKACGDATRWSKVRDVVMARFTLQPDGWHHATLDEVLTRSDEIRTTRAKSGRRGGLTTQASRQANRQANDEANRVVNGQPPDPDPDPYVQKQIQERVCVDAQRVETAVTDAHANGQKLLETSRKLVHTIAAIVETTDDAMRLRAGQLLEHYAELFYQHRRGARYHNRMHLDFQKAEELVRTWPDDARLEKLAVIVLTTDDDWISKTDRGFGVFAAKASWADDRLAAWEAEHQQAH